MFIREVEKDERTGERVGERGGEGGGERVGKRVGQRVAQVDLRALSSALCSSGRVGVGG